MAEAQQELKTDRANDKPCSITTNKTVSTTVKKTVARASRRKSAHKDGADRLRWAADKRVGRNSEKLVDVLTEKALKGDLASTKVLLALAEGKKPRPEPVERQRSPSLAEWLATEPEWKEGDPECLVKLVDCSGEEEY